MLRSQNIPTKMVKGYVNGSKTYHAWNEVYLSSEKKWITIDTTSDAFLKTNKKTYTLEKDATIYKKVKEI